MNLSALHEREVRRMQLDSFKYQTYLKTRITREFSRYVAIKCKVF